MSNFILRSWFFELVAAYEKLNTAAPPNDPIAPELSVAINTCTPPETPTKQAAASPTSVAAILEHVSKRLIGGLDHVWASQDGSNPDWWQPPANATVDEAKMILEEEGWARWCTELMTGVTYGSISMYDAAKEKDILYVSPRLLMHDTGSDANFYVSRYMWSLRNAPGFENLEVMWEFSLPMFGALIALRNAARTEPLSSIWKEPAHRAEPVLWFSTDNEGKARCVARKKTTLGGTVFEPESGLAWYGAVLAKFKRPWHEQFLAPSLGTRISVPKYFAP